MAEIRSLDTDKIRKVRVVAQTPGQSITKSAYLDGEAAWKIENGAVFVREASLSKHDSEQHFELKWTRTLDEEEAEEVIVYDWPLEKELERQRI